MNKTSDLLPESNSRSGLLIVLVSVLPLIATTCLFVIFYLYPYFSATPKPIADLTLNQWQVCYPQSADEPCEFVNTVIPKDVRYDLVSNFSGDIVYQVDFEAPNDCFDNRKGCSLFISEIGDAAVFYLNGFQIGKHGVLPPNGKYAKHYPVRIAIPASLFLNGRDNRLQIQVHSFKNVQAGLRRGPVAIFSDNDATQLSTIQIAQSIIIPLVSAFLVFLIALILITWTILEKSASTEIKALIFYCTALSFFLFSLTELPREIIPIHWAGLIHHTGRIFGDLMFFRLMRIIFFRDSKKLPKIDIIYLIVLMICPAMTVFYLVQGTVDLYGFDNTYLIRRAAFPLLLIPHLIGVFGAYRLPQSRHRLTLLLIFVFTTYCQISDSLVFHAISHGTYYVKAYPVLIALGMAYYIFHQHASRTLAETATLRANSMIGIVTRQVAHDIRSPLSALNLVATTLQNVPEEKRLMIRNATARINDIANSLLQHGKAEQNYHRNIDSNDVHRPKTAMLSSLVDTIVSEKRIQYREKIGIEIEAVLNESYGLFSSVYSSDISRAISNLVNNAVEAFSNETGKIKINVSSSGNNNLVTISDNGQGMPPEVLQKIGEIGVSYGKSGTESGSGLGVYQTKQALAKVGGRLNFESIPGQGTTVTMLLPKAPTPNWFVESIQLHKNSILVSVDDDQTIHQIWAGRMKSLGIDSNKVEHLTFTSISQFEAWFKASPKVSEAKFLVDFEFIDQKGSGLDLIERLDLGRQAILVTSRYQEANLRDRCERLNVKLIPKAMAGFVPIEVENDQTPCDTGHLANEDLQKHAVTAITNPIETSGEKIRYDLCLIDDDTQMIHTVWGMVAESKKIKIRMFANPEAFFASAATIDRQTPLFVDVSLENGIKGTDVAQEIHNLGFVDINLATGYDADSIQVPPFIRRVVGKDFPENI